MARLRRAGQSPRVRGDATPLVDRRKPPAPRRRRDVRQRAARPVEQVVRARRGGAHRARLPGPLGRRGAAQGAARGWHRRVLRAQAARALRRDRALARAAREPRRARPHRRRRRRRGALAPAFRSRRRAALGLPRGRGAAPLVPARALRGRGLGVGSREGPSRARSGLVHRRARAPARGERAARDRRGGRERHARPALSLRDDRRAHARHAAHRGRWAARFCLVLCRSRAGSGLGPPAGDDGLRPLPRAAHRRERACAPRRGRARRVLVLHARRLGRRLARATRGERQVHALRRAAHARRARSRRPGLGRDPDAV